MQAAPPSSSQQVERSKKGPAGLQKTPTGAGSPPDRLASIPPRVRLLMDCEAEGADTVRGGPAPPGGAGW